MAALVLAILALIGTGFSLYQKGKAQALAEARTAHLEELNKFYREQAIRFATSLEEHGKRAQADAKQIAQLKDRITSLDEYAESIEDRECLAGPDVERLRNLWDGAPN